MFFLCFLMSCFCCCYNINVQHCVNFGLVRVRHTPFPGQSECSVAVLLTLFDSYWRCFLLERILQFNVFYPCFLFDFYKSEKNMCFVFYLQINVFIIYGVELHTVSKLGHFFPRHSVDINDRKLLVNTRTLWWSFSSSHSEWFRRRCRS